MKKNILSMMDEEFSNLTSLPVKQSMTDFNKHFKGPF